MVCDMSNERGTTQIVRPTFAIAKPKLDRFREVAEADHRTVSSELRRLIDLRIAEAEKESA